jgi:flagellar hook-basal body complex protein FliE
MAVLPAAAAAAYQSVAKMATSSPATPTASSSESAGGFGGFLTDALKDSIQTIKKGEQMASMNLSGKADIVDVVNAVNQAELTLDTVVAVRDKVVSAYQSILNMPI